MARYGTGMMNDISRYSPEDTISRWNLTRICYVVVLIMLLEIVNLFDSDVQRTPYLLIPSCAIILAGLIVLPLSIQVLKRFDAISSPNKHRIYLYFWVFLPTLVAFSFFVRDAEANRPPLNLLIIVCLISMVPVLNVKETIMVFILPALVNLAVYAVVNCNVTYMLYSLIFCLAGVLITAVVHRRYIYLIRELNYRMLHDPLTHVLSRQAGVQKAELLLATCTRDRHCFAAMMIDIDYFKAFNDAKGHLYGDEVLAKVALAISDAFFRESDIVYRYGGEEFCVCVSTTRESVREIADRLMQKVSGLGIPSQNQTASKVLTISVGVAVCDEPGKTLEEILRRADEQLYVSKTEGRNRVTIGAC